jgi:hypothetical protein
MKLPGLPQAVTPGSVMGVFIGQDIHAKMDPVRKIFGLSLRFLTWVVSPYASASIKQHFTV